MGEGRSYWEIAREEFACSHEVTEHRRFIKEGGARCWVLQCQRCGAKVGTEIKRDLVPGRCAINPIAFDEELRDNWQSRWRAREEELKRQASTAWIDQKRLADEEQWAAYNAYLETPEWRAKRQKAMQRDDFVCQGCHVAPAVYVHHTTAAKEHMGLHGFGTEMLFDLFSVCGECHAIIHPHLRPQNNVNWDDDDDDLFEEL